MGGRPARLSGNFSAPVFFRFFTGILISLLIIGKSFLSTFLVRNRKFRGEFLNGFF